MQSISESDWKVFRQLREVALERLSQRILDECQDICSDTQTPAHKRYLTLTRTIDNRRDEVARAFDDFRRSTAILSLRVINAMDLLEESELALFTQETRRKIEL